MCYQYQNQRRKGERKKDRSTVIARLKTYFNFDNNKWMNKQINKRVSGKKPWTWAVHSALGQENHTQLVRGPCKYHKTQLEGEKEGGSCTYNRGNDETLGLGVTRERQKAVMFGLQASSVGARERRGRGPLLLEEMQTRCLTELTCLAPSSDRPHLVSVPAPGATESAGSRLRPPLLACPFFFCLWSCFVPSSGLFLFYCRSPVIQEKELTLLFL